MGCQMQRKVVMTSLSDQLPGAQLMTAGTQQREGDNAVTRGNFSQCGAVKHAGLSNVRQKNSSILGYQQ